MGTNKYLIQINDYEEAFELLKKIKEKSNIRWASGKELDDEDVLGEVYNVYDDVNYLVIRGNAVYWLDEDDYFKAPEEFLLFDLYDVNSFIEEVVDNMTKKLEVKDIAIVTSDDKYGEKLLSFLNEFTSVKFNSGDSLTSKVMLNTIKDFKDEYPNDNLIFVIKNNRAYLEIYHKNERQIYMMFGVNVIYDSVRDFLLDKDEWIRE